jgi:hypothetical protein
MISNILVTDRGGNVTVVKVKLEKKKPGLLSKIKKVIQSPPGLIY